MAKRSGLSPMTVSRIWRSFGLQPHRSETFKLSNDLCSSRRYETWSRLYLNPPERALVLCVDEKSQIQVLTAPSRYFPCNSGQAERR